MTVTVTNGKVTTKGGKVVSAVNYGNGVQKTTIASADTSSGVWECSLFSYDPTMSGSIISAYATNECTGSGYQPMQVCDTVQRSRWFGWENMATNCSGYGYVSFDDVTANYDCSGTGTHDFNGAANAYVEGGAFETPEDDSPNAPTFSC
jgi:hypothetical protein